MAGFRGWNTQLLSDGIAAAPPPAHFCDPSGVSSRSCRRFGSPFLAPGPFCRGRGLRTRSQPSQVFHGGVGPLARGPILRRDLQETLLAAHARLGPPAACTRR